MLKRSISIGSQGGWFCCVMLVGLALALTSGGCRRGPEIVSVSGKVTFNGQPLKFGSVTFQPQKGQPARGEIQSDGTFTLSTFKPGDGAVVGPHKVRVACYESQRAPANTGGGEQSLGKLLIPVKYTFFDQSGLTAEVKPSDNAPFLIELKGPPTSAL